MPSACAHAYFARDVYRTLEPKLKRKIDRDTMITFSQGPDVFYYQFLNPLRNATIHAFGRLVHTTYSKKFFIHYIDHMKRYRLEKKPEVVASLYGYLTHYLLDYYTHPLIYYKTGVYEYGNDATRQYIGKHQEMELLIDLYMLEKRERKKPAKIKLDHFLFPQMDFSIPLKNLLNRVYQDVYETSNMGSSYLSNLKQMRFIYRHFRYDPYHLKQPFYHAFATWFPTRLYRLQYTSYASELRTKIGYINYEHKPWCHPLDQTEICTDTFFDRYKKAQKEAVTLIQKMNLVLAGDMELRELEAIFPDVSYLTGKNWHIGTTMQYFEKEGAL